MNSLWIKEEYYNETDDHMIGESPIYETRYDNKAELYRSCQREWGKCHSYIRLELDRNDSQANPPVGWSFRKRMQFEGARRKDDTYLRQVWVTVCDPTGRPVDLRKIQK